MLVAGLGVQLGLQQLNGRAQGAKACGGEGVDRVPAVEGPWGRLRRDDLQLEPPPAVLLPGPIMSEADRGWRFPGVTGAALGGHLKGLGLSEACMREIAAVTVAEEMGVAVIVPPYRLVLDMAEADRVRLYADLALHPENPWHYHAWAMPSDVWEDWLHDARLSPATDRLCRRLAYPVGDVRCLADVPLLLVRAEASERQRLLSGLARCHAVEADLCVSSDADVQELMSYWAKGGTHKDLDPLFRSAARLPHGYGLDLSYLIPAATRQRLYTWSAPAAPGASVATLLGTALHFFDPPLSGSAVSEADFIETVDADCYPVSGRKAYGDLMVFISRSGRLLHGCVYLAGDVVYTKGPGLLPSPWVMMRVDALRDALAAQAPFHERIFRRRYQ